MRQVLLEDHGDLVADGDVRGVGVGPCDREYVFHSDDDFLWFAGYHCWVRYLEDYDPDVDWE